MKIVYILQPQVELCLLLLAPLHGGQLTCLTQIQRANRDSFIVFCWSDGEKVTPRLQE